MNRILLQHIEYYLSHRAPLFFSSLSFLTSLFLAKADVSRRDYLPTKTAITIQHIYILSWD